MLFTTFNFEKPNFKQVEQVVCELWVLEVVDSRKLDYIENKGTKSMGENHIFKFMVV